MQSKHFRYRVVPSGRWKRFPGEISIRGTDDARPHVIPITDEAKTFMKAETLVNGTGLCPGIVVEDDGTEVIAFRFINFDEADAGECMPDLDRLVDRVQEELRDPGVRARMN